MTDGDLVRQSIQGDRTACEALVRRWSARVLALCHARAGQSHVAEDLAQETLLRALRSLATLEAPDKFGSWVCGIAVRVCLDWRKAKQTSQVSFSALAPEARPSELAMSHEATWEQVDQADDLRQLLKAVETLPEKQREVLMLFYYQDVTYRDLAEMLGVSTATINARLTEARATLRQRLDNSRR